VAGYHPDRGRLFLLYKGTREIHQRLVGGKQEEAAGRRASFAGVVAQIMLLDVVFSLDSVITAVGMANKLWVMATAIIIAVAIMLAASKPLADFVERHPTVKMLALSFLLLIGMTLIADGAGFDVPKGYIHAAIGFSGSVAAVARIPMLIADTDVRTANASGPRIKPTNARVEDRSGVKDGSILSATSLLCQTEHAFLASERPMFPQVLLLRAFRA
jgi:predicted tellurium resistance membrane protein TerC